MFTIPWVDKYFSRVRPWHVVGLCGGHHGLAATDDDACHRAMDWLHEVKDDLEKQIFDHVAHLLNLEVDLLFFDTTSTYFERDTEDPDPDGSLEGGDGMPGFRRYGHSKDHRRDLPQIVIGLAVTREGIPVRCWCWPGFWLSCRWC